MTVGMPFLGKFQVGQDGELATFSNGGAPPSGTTLIAYVIPGGVSFWSSVIWQLIAEPPTGSGPAALMYMSLGGEEGVSLIPFSTSIIFATQFLLIPDVNDPSLVNFALQEGGAPGSILFPPGSIQWLTLGAAGGQLGFTSTTNDYSWVDLTGEAMSGLALPGAIFSYADLTNLSLNGSTMPNADFRNVASLSGASFVKSVLTSARFDGVDLTGVDFTGADLTGAIFDGAILAATELGGTNMTGASFANCDMTTALYSAPPLFSTSSDRLTSFAGATLDYLFIGLSWTCLNLSQANIVGLPASLAGLNAVYANLSGLQLSGKDLTGADFSNATLQDVNFVGSTLDSAQFVDAQLQGDSTIASAVLSGCNLIDANFQGANLTSVELSNSFFYGGAASVSKATLQLADFGGAYLEKVNFSTVLNADFEGVNFTNACLVNANFNNCNIRDFSGKRANFSGACLQGATFRGAQVFANLFNAAVAEEAGTIQVTTLFGTPPTLQTIPIPYGKTIGLEQATNSQTVCPDNSDGPCSAQQLMGTNPPTSWQPANADELRAAPPPVPCDRPIRYHGRIVDRIP